MVERIAAGLELGEKAVDSPHAICRGYDIRRRFACVQLAKLQLLESPVRPCGLAAKADPQEKTLSRSFAAREGSSIFLLLLLTSH